MKPTFLSILACPYCRESLLLIPLETTSVEEDAAESVQVSTEADFLVYIDPDRPPTNSETLKFEAERLRSFRSDENHNDVGCGLLVCPECTRFFPVIGSIPELLPDGLRDYERDTTFLDSFAGFLPGLASGEMKRIFSDRVRAAASGSGERDPHKICEMHIQDKVTDPGFWGPGYVAPFYTHSLNHTAELFKRFADCIQLLGSETGQAVLDVGCGYFWTTEWLQKLGFEAVGLDISRVYLEIGMKRVGRQRPHLVVADAERLPFKAGIFQAVLCFDALHHVPNRIQAFAEFERALRPQGNLVLAEPGEKHGENETSRDIMARFGILERGMSFADVLRYAAGKDFSPPSLHKICKIETSNPKGRIFRSAPYVDCRLYTLRKGRSPEKKAGLARRLKRAWNSLRNLAAFASRED